VAARELCLLGPGTNMSTTADVVARSLDQIISSPSTWGVYVDRIALVGESAGCTMTALVAERSARLRAQVLINPCLDLTSTALDHPSMTEPACTPTISAAEVEPVCRLAAPAGSDARAVSPIATEGTATLPNTLLVVPALDPLA